MTMTRSRYLISGLILFICGCWLVGCSASNPAPTLGSATAPVIVTQPANQTVTVGQTATFSVTATGTASLSYQWQENGSNISGATSASYTTAPTALTDNAAKFQVMVSNSAGTVASNPATLTVNPPAVSVLTYHNDNARTGQNINETMLTPANVKSATFGKLFSQPVDGQLYAQPLYVPNLAIPGQGTHNVVFVATEADSVYAFDADTNTGANANPLWKVSLIDAAHGAATGATTVASSDTGCPDLKPQIGVTSTPVIDATAGVMYVEARSKENGVFVHRLHVLDITSGAEKSPGPAMIAATAPGTGEGGTLITFNSLQEQNRAGLLLLNGAVYVGFASLCDTTPYHGWLLAYNSTTLAQTGVFLTTPNGLEGEGGIWQAGAGPSADSSGNIFLATGNGAFDATDFAQSILKLLPAEGKLSLADYFTPFNEEALDGPDSDVGSSGVLLLPDQPGSHPHELVLAGKAGTIYLVDRDQMTADNIHFCANNCGDTDPEIVQEVPSAVGGMWSMPAYWNNTLYFWGTFDAMRAFNVSNGLLGAAPTSTTTLSVGIPSPTPSISSSGNTNGIVWAIDATQNGPPQPGPGPTVLHAYDATNLANELYNSAQMGTRDQAGYAVKFTVPTVVNGKVYVGTVGELDIYGLLQQ